MDLLIVRHGLAGNREESAATGQPDDLRPLTKKGVKQMEMMAVALRRLVPRLDVIATSPLIRARQTADVLASVFELEASETDLLRPVASRQSLVNWIGREINGSAAALVGHEPHLSALVAWLIGDINAQVSLRKGGACFLRFETTPRHGTGTLLWLLSPRVVKDLRA